MSERLRQRLLERIHERGPLTFAEFMEAALYDPHDGFFARPPVGENGHFVTSPHVSRAFGDLLARQLAQVWDHLGRPSPFTVAEVGAGDGTLARQIREAVESVPDLAGSLRYVAVERSPGAMRALQDAGVEAVSGLRDAGPLDCVVANELLDNLPFHRLRERGGRVVEIGVGAADGRLVEVEREPTPGTVEALAGPLATGEERPVSLAARAFVRAVAQVLRRGYVFLFDYGFSGAAPADAVHAYRDHRVLGEVLEDPGSRDVTAAVDLRAIADEAGGAGLTVWGPVSQREALLGLGLRSWIHGLRTRMTEAQISGRWRDAARLYAERSRASILIDPQKLGGLQLLVFGTPGLPAPAAAIGDRQSGC